jgi:hypothetical protein
MDVKITELQDHNRLLEFQKEIDKLKIMLIKLEERISKLENCYFCKNSHSTLTCYSCNKNICTYCYITKYALSLSGESICEDFCKECK